MEPEGVVDALRNLVSAVVPGGIVVDLAARPPDGLVLHGGQPVGSVDESLFFERSEVALAGLDVLVGEGFLVQESEERFPVLISYPTGADLVEDVASRTYGRFTEELAERIAAIAGPVQIQENNQVRRFRKPANASGS